jgi:hypothetical protein
VGRLNVGSPVRQDFFWNNQGKDNTSGQAMWAANSAVRPSGCTLGTSYATKTAAEFWFFFNLGQCVNWRIPKSDELLKLMTKCGGQVGGSGADRFQAAMQSKGFNFPPARSDFGRPPQVSTMETAQMADVTRIHTTRFWWKEMIGGTRRPRRTIQPWLSIAETCSPARRIFTITRRVEDPSYLHPSVQVAKDRSAPSNLTPCQITAPFRLAQRRSAPVKSVWVRNAPDKFA